MPRRVATPGKPHACSENPSARPPALTPQHCGAPTAIDRARIFIDTDAALSEAGDITQPTDAGRFSRDRIAGSLFTLCRGEAPGRRNATEITLFKSVGSAIEDLAAAALVWSDFRPA